jgi:predicted nucleotidyltransferase
VPRLSPEQFDAVAASLAALDPQAVYVFGSYGTSCQHPGSDLDIAVLCSSAVDPLLIFRLANELSERLGIEVDLVDLSVASTVMRKEVLRTGQRILTVDFQSAEEFEMLTLSDYARLNEERAEIIAQ